MRRGGVADEGPEGPGDGPAQLPEDLRRELEELGLSPYEARALLALLRLGVG